MTPAGERIAPGPAPSAGSRTIAVQQMEMPMRLKDKIAVVTGAGSGIGKDIAVVYAGEGARVAIADLDETAAAATAREIDPTGQRALGVAMDVANEEQVEAGIAKVIKTFGGLDILVSNAGIQIVAPLVEFEFAKWKKLLAI